MKRYEKREAFCCLFAAFCMSCFSGLLSCFPWRRGVWASISYASEDGEYKARAHCVALQVLCKPQDEGKRRMFVVDGRGKGHNLEEHGFVLSQVPLERTEGHDLYDYLVCSRVLYPLAEVQRNRVEIASKSSRSLLFQSFSGRSSTCLPFRHEDFGLRPHRSS